MKTILIISFSDIARDPRVSRQAKILARHYDITVAGTGQESLDGVSSVFLDAPPRRLATKLLDAALLKMGMFEKAYWRRETVRAALQSLTGRRFDLVLANDIDALPVALRLAGSAPVLMDAHEYSPREFEESRVWRMIMQPYKDYLCRTYLPRAAGMLTVCQGIADEYARVYGVTPKVVMNAPMEQDLRPVTPEAGRVRLIHHGVAMPSRHPEKMIEMMRFLDARFTLDFMLISARQDYLDQLVKLAAGDSRIKFVAPVAMPDIPRVCNQYDIGVFILPPVNFNYTHALPNKFFEFVQARLGVAIGPTREMASLVEHYKLGVVADSFEPGALAGKLNALTTEDVIRFKENAHRAARELSFEHSGEVLLCEVRRLLGE